MASATAAAMIPGSFTATVEAPPKPYRAGKPLLQLQQEFVDLRFGMFVHFNMATFQNREWGDPDRFPWIVLDSNPSGPGISGHRLPFPAA